jgi:hypothetical protein
MLQKAEITNKSVGFASPGRHQITGETGLYLWVSPGADTRRWIYRYTSPVSKKPTEAGLGLWPTVTLTMAKDKAVDLRRMVAQGTCPISAKRNEKASRVTFREACEQWLEVHKATWKDDFRGWWEPDAQLQNLAVHAWRGTAG